MDKKRVTIFMTVLCVLLLGISMIVYLGKDREGPEIMFLEDSISYSEGDDTAVFLADVTAIDNRDGDVSDMVKVDRVTSMPSLNYVVVTYVARDRSNNISKRERWINLTDGSTVDEPTKKLEEEESETPIETMTLLPEEQTQAPGETEESEMQSNSGLPDDGADQTEEVIPTEAEGQLPTETASETETISSETEEVLVSTGAPIIRVTSHDITLHLGERFDYMNYVKMCVDDVDTTDQLYSRIVVNGEDGDGNYVGAGTIDTNRLTTYKLKYYVMDSDGNMSNIEEMTVRIEE